MDTRIIITEKLERLPYKYDASRIAQILDCTADHQVRWLDELIDRGAPIALHTLPYLFMLNNLFSFTHETVNDLDTVQYINAQVAATLSTLFKLASSLSSDEITSELSVDYFSYKNTRPSNYFSQLRVQVAELCVDALFGNQQLSLQTKITFINHLILQGGFYPMSLVYYVGRFFATEASADLILKKAKGDLERKLEESKTLTVCHPERSEGPRA